MEVRLLFLCHFHCYITFETNVLGFFGLMVVYLFVCLCFIPAVNSKKYLSQETSVFVTEGDKETQLYEKSLGLV